MIKKIFLLLIVIIILCNTACSFYVKSRFRNAEPANTRWKPSGFCGKYHPRVKFTSYSYHHENVALSICLLFSEERIVLFGPPYLPIIPNIFFLLPKRAEKFFIQIYIESMTDTTSIDFSQASMKLPGGISLKPSLVHMLQSDNNFEKIQLYKVVVSHKKKTYYLIFDVLESETDDFTFDLGNIKINDNNFQLKPLRFREGSGYNFYPVIVAD